MMSGSADDGFFIDPSKTVVDDLLEDIEEPDSFVGNEKKVDFNKTMIMSPDDDQQHGITDKRIEQQRKLIGFLVTFTWNKFGDYFEIRYGKTKIGGGESSDIRISDGMASEVHAQLVYRQGVLRIKDNFSTNGTWVNDKDIGDSAEVLSNRDLLKIGNTVFKLLLIEGE